MTEILVYQNEIICSIEDHSVFHGVCLECKTTTVLSSLSLSLSFCLSNFNQHNIFQNTHPKLKSHRNTSAVTVFVAWLLFNFIVSIALKLLVSKYSILFVHSLVLSRSWPHIFLMIFIEDNRKSVKFVFCFLKYETPI